MNIWKRSRLILGISRPACLGKYLATCLALGCLCGISTAQAIDPLTYFSGRHRIRPACNVPPGDYQYLPRTPAVSSGSLPALPRHSQESMERAIQAARNPGFPQASMTPLAAIPFAQNPISNPLMAPPLGVVPDPRLSPWNTNPWTTNPWTSQVPTQMGAYPNAFTQNVFPNSSSLAPSTNSPTVRPDSKTLQMAAPFLDVAHCRIRDASIAIDPQGNWTISFKAEQNPLLDRNAIVRNVDLQLKRNLFVMDARLTDAAVSRTIAVSAAAQTLPTIENHRSTGLVQLQVPRISIQRESSEFYTFHGNDPKIAQHFERIQGAEFQFYALLDPLTGSGQGVVMPWQHPSWKK